jgi:hypothetical protein
MKQAIIFTFVSPRMTFYNLSNIEIKHFSVINNYNKSFKKIDKSSNIFHLFTHLLPISSQ